MGKSPYALIKAVRDWDGTRPVDLARLRRDHPLDRYDTRDLVSHLEAITGMAACEIFDLAGQGGASDPESMPRDVLVYGELMVCH